MHRSASRRPAAALLAALGLAVLLAVAGCDLATSESPSPDASPTRDPAATPVPEGPVRFTTEDGVELEGQIFGTGSRAVVLAHMQPADMTSWFPFAQVLADNGYRVLAFNFRGYGDSGGDGYAVDLDARAAADFMVADGAEGVALIGASMGGTGSIAAAANNPDIVGIIALSAPFEFEGVDAKLLSSEVDAPMLLFVGDRDVDEFGGPYNLHAVELGRANPDTTTILTLTGDAHGTELIEAHEGIVTDQTLAFLERAFGEADQ